MAAVRVTCPECEAVLKLAAAPTPGKKLKCPKCENVFAPPANGEEEDDPDRPVKTAARKPMAPKPKPKAAAAPKKVEDDDEDGGTYELLDKKEHDEDAPDVDHAPTVAVKDPRGVAVVKLVRPANFLMMCGAISFVSWLLVFTIAFIRFFLPVQDDSELKEENWPTAKAITPVLGALTKTVDLTDPQVSEKEKQLIKDREDAARSVESDLIALFIQNVVIFIVLLIIGGLAMTQAGLIMTGAVRMAHLDSRGWGIASSILALFPFYTNGVTIMVSGLLTVLSLLLTSFGLDLLTGVIGLILGVVAPAISLFSIFSGVYALKTLLSEDVKTAFEYEPE